MSRRPGLVLAVLLLSGCRIVSQQELAALKNPPNPNLSSVAQAWQQKLVPQVVQEAKPLAQLMKDLQAAKDFDDACQRYGYRSQAENPCVFSVRLQGEVTALNSKSRSGKMTVQEADGAQVTVQTGPIIRGTALRDAYKGVSYQDFNDQVLFGDYGRAINQQAADMMKTFAPKVGDKVAIAGVFSSWDIPQQTPDITPAQISRQP
ncbi:DUF2291 family protein [[Erwinia] mediterraneensis]|uniref:DUF2291 family protein n=1 Tax=[Erwinia] mediterraneensis TaxID=2161819 RepID=UPI0010307537|nr:DUF2291 domain-containing protein [[Erwinia] mediterraneensis]